MIRVCDTIMGSGKTSASINYINEHPEKHFLYITPYLDEAARVKKNCPQADFVEPNNYSEATHSKISHTLSLLEEERNIVSTHQAASLYTKDIISILEKKDYCIIIDEAISVLNPVDTLNREDIDLLVQGGYLEQVASGDFRRTSKEYNGVALEHLLKDMAYKTLTIMNGGISERVGTGVYYYSFPMEFLELPNDMFILTYLFENSMMELLMRIHDIPYQYIYVDKDGNEKHVFSTTKRYTPEYIVTLKDKIHILDNERMNSIGDDRTSLSIGWHGTQTKQVEQLKNNLYNYFGNLHREDDCKRFLCGTYKKYMPKIKGRGYAKALTVFSEKATNKYSNRDILAYPVNIYPNPYIGRYFAERGVVLDEDKYALSIMIQWIWRSAIRNGEDIELYLPSKRMRRLLTSWIDEVVKDATRGGDVIDQ